MDFLIYTLIGGFILYAITGAIVRIPGKSMQGKFQDLGTLKGRTLHSIIAEVGPPNAKTMVGDGRILYQWITTGYHISLIFTGDVCDGVTHESST